jgi:hypothetical protein
MICGAKHANCSSTGPTIATVRFRVPHSFAAWLLFDEKSRVCSCADCKAATPRLSVCAGNCKQQWEVTVENKSDRQCSFFVSLGTNGDNNAKVENVAPGESISLIAGISDTVVRTVKVLHGDDEQTLAPNMALPVGKKYAIKVDADGKLDASVLAR